MNVTKCANNHFFDADKYPRCPHCGAAPVDAASADAKKVKGDKKKAKQTADRVVEMPQGTIGRTVGVFGNGASDANRMPIQSEQRGGALPVDGSMQKDKPLPEAIVFCGYCGKPYNKADGHHCAACPPQKEKIETPVYNKNVVEEAEIPASNTSLQEAVKKATAGSQGKTVGFFGMRTSGDSAIKSEPVVGWLVGVKGKHFGESFVIVAGRNAIGRDETNTIVLSKDETVSRSKHAWMTYEPKRREFYVQPGEGSGLSYINNDIIMEMKKVQANDVLEFGGGQYIFVPLCGENFTWEDYLNKE